MQYRLAVCYIYLLCFICLLTDYNLVSTFLHTEKVIQWIDN